VALLYELSLGLSVGVAGYLGDAGMRPGGLHSTSALTLNGAFRWMRLAGAFVGALLGGFADVLSGGTSLFATFASGHGTSEIAAMRVGRDATGVFCGEDGEGNGVAKCFRLRSGQSGVVQNTNFESAGMPNWETSRVW